MAALDLGLFTMNFVIFNERNERARCALDTPKRGLCLLKRKGQKVFLVSRDHQTHQHNSRKSILASSYGAFRHFEKRGLTS